MPASLAVSAAADATAYRSLSSAAMPERHRESLHEAIDATMATLRANKGTWARMPVDRKIEYLDAIRANTARIAREWTEDAVKAKGLRMDSPLAGEEWISGPFSVLEITAELRSTLVRIAEGRDVLEGVTARTLPSGQVAVDVFPMSARDRVLFSGISAEVRMQPEVTLETLDDTVATFYRQEDPPGDVCVVLAAGNIASIAVLDVIYAVFNEGKVAILKMNPVNDYLGAYFEQVFAELVADGFVAFAYGGPDVGEYLTSHPDADSIHITGSAATYEAIVFGPGADGAANKAAGVPINPRSIEAELGGVGAVIVVPGPWTARDIRFQAEHIASMKLHNSGFNCVSAQVLVLPDGWEHTDALLDEVRSVLAEADDRPPYYPGAPARAEALAERGEADRFGGEHPRYLVSGIDAASVDEPAFREEVFAPALAVTRLPAPDVVSYLIKAVRFANEQLTGTLGINILIDPHTRRRHSDALDRAIDDLRYGTIAINLWTAAAYFLSTCAWGAHPGHTPADIGSGMGHVHNVLMFDKPQKSVVSAPFAPGHRSFLRGEFSASPPKPLYFITNRAAHVVGERLIDYAMSGSAGDLARVVSAALRG